jgi:hypothetical protein
MLRALAAFLLLAPAAVPAGDRAATLQMSVQVRRSLTVSVETGAGAPSLVVRTAGGAVWRAPLAGAAAASGGAVRAEPSAEHPGYVVVTVLADLRN